MPLVRKPAQSAPAATPDAAGVLQALTSPDQAERWAAARAAADVAGGPTALAAALQTEPDPHVREAMFTSLARAGTPQSIQGILSLLRSDNANLRTGALDALRTTCGSASRVLPQLLTDSDADIRILSCELARCVPSGEATRLLCSLLAAELQVNVCAAAVEVLAEVGGPDALPVLRACAQRFGDAPFLGFAIKIAADRIQSQSPPDRA